MSSSRYVTLGLHKTAADYKNALKRTGVRLVNDAGDYVSIMPISKERKHIGLSILDVKDLGFDEGTSYGEICSRAESLDLRICPAEVGPALMLDYPDQPLAEWIAVAMQPLRHGPGTPCIFRMRRGDGEGARLYVISGSPEALFSPYHKFIFDSH